MATFYTKETGHVQLDPVDGTFALPILAQLLAYLDDYAWVFPDERFPQERRTMLGRLQSPGLGSHSPFGQFGAHCRPLSAQQQICPG